MDEWLREVSPAFKGLMVPVVTIWDVVLASVRFSGQCWGAGGGREPSKKAWWGNL